MQRLTAGGTTATPEIYGYDAQGNRTASHLSAAHVSDAANRLTEDDSFTYTYDLNGNLETKTDKANPSDVTTYGYDAQNQLVSIDFPDQTSAAYLYDGLGRRIEKDVAGVKTRYVYDGEDIAFEFDGAGAVVARFGHGDGRDQPLVVERGGQSYFYHADHRGSVRQITNAAGGVVNSYDYDAYGRIESITEGIANPYAFTGREWDAESGLYYYRARTYDPDTGRFLQEDPIDFNAGDANLYRYVFNNPVNLRDPDGLAGRKNRGRGGKRKLNVEGFTPQSNLGALESHIDSILNTRENLKRLEQLKALRKVIKRGGTMCIFFGSVD